MPPEVTVAWVNHAHNDYLELLLETGLPGLLLMLAFLGWFVLQTARVWRSPFASLFAKAATIAAAAILVHSIVDYPLRTASIVAILAGLSRNDGPAAAAEPQRRNPARPDRLIELLAAGELGHRRFAFRRDAVASRKTDFIVATTIFASSASRLQLSTYQTSSANFSSQRERVAAVHLRPAGDPRRQPRDGAPARRV